MKSFNDYINESYNVFSEDEPFGYELMIDLYECNEKIINDKKKCSDFLKELTDFLKMEKQNDPVVFYTDSKKYPDKKGISGWIALIESGIQIHTLVDKKFVSIDIYSTKKFDIKDVEKFVKDYFGSDGLEKHFLKRGINYNFNYSVPSKLIKDKKIDKFIRYAIKEMSDSDVRIHLLNKKFIYYSGTYNDNEKSIGCFSDDGYPEFICAIGSDVDTWFPVFVHEFCHYMQWAEKSKYWNILYEKEKCQKVDVSSLMDDWIGGKEFPKNKIEDYVKRTQECERDCERKTSKIIVDFNLPIKIDEYIRGANAYLYFYTYLLKKRVWYKETPPYKIKEVLKLMPNDKILDDHSRISDEVIKIFNSYYEKKK